MHDGTLSEHLIFGTLCTNEKAIPKCLTAKRKQTNTTSKKPALDTQTTCGRLLVTNLSLSLSLSLSPSSSRLPWKQNFERHKSTISDSLVVLALPTIMPFCNDCRLFPHTQDGCCAMKVKTRADCSAKTRKEWRDGNSTAFRAERAKQPQSRVRIKKLRGSSAWSFDCALWTVVAASANPPQRIRVWI